MATLYIVRHGHIARDGCFIGRTDVPLSALGHKQAVKLGRLLSPIAFDACFSSPLIRSLETSRHILAENTKGIPRFEKAVGAREGICEGTKDMANNTDTVLAHDCEGPIVLLPALKEISLGLWEGKTKAEVMAEYPFIWEQRGVEPAVIAPPEGENYSMLYARLSPVFQRLAFFKKSENVLVVAHRSIGQVLMGHFSGFPFETWPLLNMPYGSVTLCPLLP